MMLNSFGSQNWTAAIVNHLWQSTAVMLVAWAITLALKRNRARTRYWVWMAASLKFLLPFSLLIALGANLSPKSLSGGNHPEFAGAVIKIAQTYFPRPQPSLPAAVAQAPAAPVTPSLHHAGAAQIVALLWFCGSLFLLLRWSRDWFELRDALRSAAPVPLPFEVPAFLTPRRIEPGIVGFLRPALLFPEKLLEQLSATQLHSILAHESCHVRRRDNLTAALHMVVEAIFWFHPAVWWIERRLIEERERACDEAVLELGNQAETYAQGILNVCKMYAGSRLACVAGVTGSELKQRLVRIMSKQVARELDFGRKALLTAAGIVMIAAPAGVGALHVREAHAQSGPVAHVPSGPVAHVPSGPAQETGSLVATWQGILQSEREYRFVVKITRRDDGKFDGTFYNIDAAPGGLPLSIMRNGASLTFDLGFASYEGNVSADGNSITGRWKQDSTSLPLSFSRATPASEWTIPKPPPRLPAMAADADPVFEVATIKPSRPDERGPRYQFNQRRFSVVHVTLSQLLQFAYNVQEREIADAPEWFSTEPFDISAEPGGEGEPSIKQWRSMVKKLLADRFQFKYHTEKRELPVYTLTIAKTGPKVLRSQGDPNGSAGLGFGPPGNMGATNATMAEIAEALQQGAVDRPVVDQTGLGGRFNLRLKWMPDELRAAAENTEALPDFFTAIQEQWGLKMVSTRAQVDVIVVDRVERPSEN